MFHVGSLASFLPPGMTQYGLAQELSAHMRAVRGYRWAFSGYHATGAGFWLSLAYYGDGLFLADAYRNPGVVREADIVAQAFRAKLAQPDDSGMTDPALYDSEVVHLSSPVLGAKKKADILRSPQCSLSPRQGHRRVVILQYLPIVNGLVKSASAPPAKPVQATTQSVSTSAPKSNAPVWTAADAGKTCGKCNRVVKPLTILGVTEYNCMC